MGNIYFDFNGKTYSGYLLSSEKEDSKYFWFVFNEEEMSDLFGDTIAFHIQGEELLPVYQYTNRASFIEYLRKKVEAALLLNSSKKQYSREQ